MFGRVFDEKGQKSVNMELLGPELYGTRLTFSHFLFIDFYKIQDHPSGFSTTRETLVPHVFVSPPPPSSAGRVYDGSFSSIAISTNPPAKSYRMTLNWRRIAL
jgi:hypothetical protein